MRPPHIALTLAAAAAIVATTALPATAEQETTATESAVVTAQAPSLSGVLVQTEAEPIWDSARMKAAGIKEAPAVNESAQDIRLFDDGPDVSVDPIEATVDVDINRIPRNGPTANGRLFFNQNGKDLSCSASVIRSDRENSVVTAGHCIFDGEWSKHIAFVPQYSDGEAPLGVWPYDEAVIHRQWKDNQEQRYNVGVINVRTVDGEEIQNVTGANGYATGRSVEQDDVLVGGWSRVGDLDSSYDSCQGDSRESRRDEDQAQLKCNLRVGAEGGPWVEAERRTDGGLGRLIGVTQKADGKRVYTYPIDCFITKLLRQ